MAPDPFWYQVGMLVSIFASAGCVVVLVSILYEKFPDSRWFRRR